MKALAYLSVECASEERVVREGGSGVGSGLRLPLLHLLQEERAHRSLPDRS